MVKNSTYLNRRRFKIPSSQKTFVNTIDTRPKFILKAGSRTLTLGEKTQLMGIINVTPDSFSHDGCWHNNPKKTIKEALRLAQQQIREGANLLDIGGESTRPGAAQISTDQEIERIIPTIQRLAKDTDVPLSVDTYKTSVTMRALDAGATIVNNIMGAKPDKALLKMVKNYDAAIILMHMRGTPRTMQKNIHYRSLIIEICQSLQNSIEKCLETGIKSDSIIIDPGIGFGKTVEHNLKILNGLKHFKILNKPILIGTSRKSFIGKILEKDVDQRLIGTVATVCSSIHNGAHIVRVHDVKAAKETASMTDAILNEHY